MNLLGFTQVLGATLLVLSHAHEGISASAQAHVRAQTHPAARPHAGKALVDFGSLSREEAKVIARHAEEVLDGHGAHVKAIVTSQQLKLLKSAGFPADVLIKDLDLYLDNHLRSSDGHAKSSYGKNGQENVDPLEEWYLKYHDGEHIERHLQVVLDGVEISKGVNDTFFYAEIGKTVQGRPIYVYEIGNPSAPSAIYIQGGLHAREWISPAAVTFSLEKIIRAYAKGEDKDLFDNIRFAIVPLINIDGYDHSRKGDRLWRKNRAPIDSEENCIGVDLNRNFNGFGTWKSAEDDEKSMCSSTYSGEEPYSEPEVHAVVTYLKNLRQRHNVIGALDVHSYSQTIFYPYGYSMTAPPPPNLENHLEAGHLMQAAMKNASGAEYGLAVSAEIAACSGCADDYLYDKVVTGPFDGGKGLVYTLELRPKNGDPLGFVLPPEQIIPAGRELYAGIMAMANYLVSKVQ